MSRELSAASSQYLETGSPPFTTLPFTMSQWFNVTRTGSSDGNFFLGDSGTVDNRFWASARSNGNWGIAASAPGGGGSGSSDAGAYSADTWHNGVGVWRTNSDREAFLDGVGGNISTLQEIPTGVDTLSIGRFGDSTPGAYLDGLIAYFTLWDVALTDAEVASLPFVHPFFIRPESIVFSMDFDDDGDNDRVGGLHLPSFNGPTLSSDGPAIIMQSSPRLFTGPRALADLGPNF